MWIGTVGLARALLFSNMLLLHKTPLPPFQSKSAEKQNDEVDKRARREKKYSVR